MPSSSLVELEVEVEVGVEVGVRHGILHKPSASVKYWVF